MNVTINSSKLKGQIKIPPSKSVAHRSIISGALSNGKSIIKNIDYSKDIISTIEALTCLGVNITKKENAVEIVSNKLYLKKDYINCNESGSTLRFLIPIALTLGKSVTFDGENFLKQRPLYPYFKIFEKSNIFFEINNKLPLYLKGQLKSGSYVIQGDVSSQFITGLLFALPLVGDSEVHVLNCQSKGYIDITIDVLKDFGVNVINNNYETFYIKKSSYIPRTYEVEGDYSQIAFFALGGIIGEEITVTGLNLNSKQGDKNIINVLNTLGVKYKTNKDGYTFYNSSLKGDYEINIQNMPDFGPVLFCIGTVIKGTLKIKGIERLKIKECDRVLAMVTELKKLGANIENKNDYVIIKGGKPLKSNVTLNGWNDHRVVMSLAVLCSTLNNTTITDATSVNKSYPKFFEDFNKIGGKTIFTKKD